MQKAIRACKAVRHAQGIADEIFRRHPDAADGIAIGQAGTPVIPAEDGEHVGQRGTEHGFHQVLRYARTSPADKEDGVVAVLGEDDCAEASAIGLYRQLLRNSFGALH